MFFDLPIEQLVEYRPPRVEPDDFDAFWEPPWPRRANTRWTRVSSRWTRA